MPLAHNFTASPPNLPGYFSPQTSAVNFCEIDYEITPYLAEFINSLTNLTYIYFAITTLPAHSSKQSKSPTLINPLSWPPLNISLLLVGLGSFIFHATLKHSAQIADELGMYAIVSTLNYTVYTHRFLTSIPAKLLFAVTLASSASYVLYANYVTHYRTGIDIHTMLFVALLTAFWPRTLWLINHPSPSHFPITNNPTVNGSTAKTSASSLCASRLRTFNQSALSFILGFGIWLVDGFYCDTLRSLRAQIALPFAWLLEFHGWWHVLTAAGAGGFVILVSEIVRTEGLGEKGEGNGVLENGGYVKGERNELVRNGVQGKKRQ